MSTAAGTGLAPPPCGYVALVSETTQTGTTGRVRFGLVGTGFWAEELHAAGIAGHPDAELVSVWGRDQGKAQALADRHGASAPADVDDLLAEVDAVAFAVPPHVQAPLAVRAARAGRHLLLEKPVALDSAAAAELVDAVDGAGVASVVFFTSRYVPEVAAWIDERAAAGCLGGRATWLASLKTPDNPFAHSPWRREQGALWDVGPHALSVLVPILGPVVGIAGARGREDLVHLVLTHDGGATSTLDLSLTMPPESTRVGVEVYDEHGWSPWPEVESDEVIVHQHAVSQLVEMVRAGRTEHPCDVRFGAQVVDVLERAARTLDGH